MKGWSALNNMGFGGTAGILKVTTPTAEKNSYLITTWRAFNRILVSIWGAKKE